MNFNHNITRYFATFILAMSAVLSFTSCEKVIEIDLNEADRRYVVEGAVYEGVDSVMVRVSKTTSYFDTNPPQGLVNATVQLTMPDNSIINLDHVGDGWYKTNGLTVVANADYSLKVEIDGQTFTADSHMEPTLPLDSLEYEYQEPLFGSDDGYSIFLNFQDEVGKNYYRIVSSHDGEVLDEPEHILVVDDNLNDGNYIRIPIFTHLFQAGDTVVADLQSIDSELYEFYQTFAAAASEDAGSPFAAAPANPESNIKGGALGVFGAYTTSKKTIIIPE